MRTVLHTESSRGLGGQEIRILDEARWTRERGWRVIVACQPDSGLHARARSARLETFPRAMTAAWDPRVVVALARLITRERVDLVHTHSSVDGWLGGAAARLARVPVVRTRHVSIPIRGRWNPVYTWLADRVITSGEAIRRMVVDAGVAADRVVAIPAGVDLERFPYRPRPQARTDVGDEPGPIIGSVAMFRGSKGHAHLIEAFRVVRSSYPRATLLLVGDGIRRRWVEDLARGAGVADAVTFTGFRDDVAAWLARMDCFVLASTRTEGVPQSLLQAFATGVPVVASEIGGVPEVVIDGETGLLVKAESATELARGIEMILADAASAQRRASRGRRLVEERFSHRQTMACLHQLYETVLAHRRA